MRYALFSDVHANLPALDAVLEDVRSRARADAIYHLGDLVGCGASPNEVVERIDVWRVPGVAGNYDSTVATEHPHCGCRTAGARQEELARASYAWTQARVSRRTRGLLGGLPFRIDLKPLGGHAAGRTVTLVHATPTSNLVYVTEERADAFLAKMARQARLKPGDVLCFGHTHLPWQRVVDGVLFVNTGSVGRPRDGDPRAAYVVLDVGGESADAELVRVAYDVDAAAASIRASGLPEELAELLRTGGRPMESRV